MEQQGKRGVDKWIPHLLGHEGFGEVLAIGPGVTKCNVGSRVILSWIVSLGINAETARYTDADGEIVNSGKVTTFSTITVVSENRVFVAPSGFKDELLPLFGCAILTGGGMALKYASEAKADAICIVGFGGIGSAAALVLKGMGMTRVDIIESSIEKRSLAHRLGFNNIYPNFTESSKNYSLVIEASGDITAIEKGFESLSKTGVLVFATHPGVGMKICLEPHGLIQGKRIFGTWGGEVNPDVDAIAIAKLLLASGANLDLLLGETFTIDEVNEGLAYLDSGKCGRPILKLKGN